MSGTAFETIGTAAELLKLDLSGQELAVLAEKERFTENDLNAVQTVFSYLAEKKKEMTIQTLLRMSHLPTKEPRTFLILAIRRLILAIFSRLQMAILARR